MKHDCVSIDAFKFSQCSTCLYIFAYLCILVWSNGNAFVSGRGGPRFKTRAGQIGSRVVANGSLPRRHFFEKSCVARAQ